MAYTLSQIYFLSTSISSVFMGMNCILFCFCVYVLWGQNRTLILLSSIAQFVLCIAQATFYITYLIDAFAAYAGGAESYLQKNNYYSLPCYIIFMINYAIEEFLLIWRVYVLYDYNVKICIPPIILLALQVGLAGVTARGYAKEATISGALRAFALATWALIAAVNISATVLICVRLWIASQRAQVIPNPSKYKSTIIVVVECGALVTICTIAMLILCAVERPGDLAGIGITTQVATMAPLLIIARHGILSRQDDRLSLASQMPLRITVVRTEVTHVDVPMDPIRKSRRISDFLPEFPRGGHSKPFCDT